MERDRAADARRGTAARARRSLGPRQELGREAAMEEARRVLKAAGYPTEYAEFPGILCSEVSLTEVSHAV